MKITALRLPMMMYGIFKAQVAAIDKVSGEKIRDKKGRIKYVYKNRKYTPENSDGIYPSVNHMYVNGPKGSKRLSKGAEELKDKWYIEAQIWAKDTGWKMTDKEKVVVDLIAYFPSDKKKRDASNALKLMLDAFEDVIYVNDTYALPRIIDFHHVKEGEEPYFELYIYKKEDEMKVVSERIKEARKQET